LNIRQPRFDTEQRPEKVISVLLELSLGLLEAFEFEIERFFFCDLFWSTVFEAAEVLFSSELPFYVYRISFLCKKSRIVVILAPFSKDSSPRILDLLDSSPFQGRFLTSFLQIL
jgi:hypothetical protein